MKRIRVAALAEQDLDDIWYHVAKNSGNIDIANRVIDSIAEAFLLLARVPEAGTISRVMHGRRDQQVAYRDDYLGCRLAAASAFHPTCTLEASPFDDHRGRYSYFR